jgi:uncharacterized protein
MDELVRGLSKSQQAELAEDHGSNPSTGPTMGDVVAQRYNRRDLLKGLLAVPAIGAVSALAIETVERANAQTLNTTTTPSFTFTEIPAASQERDQVAEGYDADVLIRWGDPVLPGAPAFDPRNQTAATQALQFGYNNDYIGYFPIEGSSEHGLLAINHEYTNEELMFPGLGRQDTRSVAFRGMTKALADVEMMAHGGSVIEVRKTNGKWAIVPNSRYARRITAETPMEITGPARGHARMRTGYDPTGTLVRGMLNNCAGGRTPWGTWLTCEENVNGYFWGDMPESHPEFRNYRRMGIPGRWYNWGTYYDRFDVTKEPNEANRFGWTVEIDPFDPTFVPKKRTAMGRFKHEGAAGIISGTGHYVIYQGDDERFDYVYRFVSKNRVTGNRAQDQHLLEDGTLSVARYDADGTVHWLPLVFGQGPLTAANGFQSQADVMIETRRASDLLGATRMDRPEDVEANVRTQRIYVMLTNNTRRTAEQVNPSNPRADNRFGHIIEMIPPGDDHTAATFRWDVLVRCGDPAVAAVGATFSPNTTRDGWFGMPDNCAIDSQGRLWVGTDGNSPSRTGRADGLWAFETHGEARATSKLFYRCPAGAELCGPEFVPDDTSLFIANQHPGEADPEDSSAPPTSFENASTRWPDFRPDMPPRPSIVAITKRGGGKIA